MSLFTLKPKAGIEDFCRTFYDDNLVNAVIAGTDLWATFVDQALRTIREADAAFAPDAMAFKEEMTAVRFEMFGVAWMHRLKKDKYTLPQAVFTKRYLEERGLAVVWKAGLEYNQAVATSTILSKSKFGSIFITRMRVDLFTKWVESGIDPECAGRVANRFGTDVKWTNGPGFPSLSLTFQKHLGLLNNEADFRLQSVIRGFYEGAKVAIQEVDVVA